jgi:hypothetical protein
MTVLKARVSDRRGAAEELRRLFRGGPISGLVVAGFDEDGKLCGVAVNSEHRALSWVKVWELAELATELGAQALTVFVFPSGPSPTPTAHELAVFRDLMVRARRARFVLLDCNVFRGDRMWSLREMPQSRPPESDL